MVGGGGLVRFINKAYRKNVCSCCKVVFICSAVIEAELASFVFRENSAPRGLIHL